MQNNKDSVIHLLEFTKHRYDSSLHAMLDIGDINIDDIYELMKITHEQLKELLNFLNEKPTLPLYSERCKQL